MLQEAASSMRFSTPSSPINVPRSSADMHVSRHAVLCALVLFCFAACLVAVTGCASQPMATDEGTAGFPSTPSSQGTDAPEQSPSSPPQARPPLPQIFPMPTRQTPPALSRLSSRKRAGGPKMATCITACRLPRYSQLLEKRIKRMRGKESSSRTLLAKTNHLIANRHIWLAGLRFPSFRHR